MKNIMKFINYLFDIAFISAILLIVVSCTRGVSNSNASSQQLQTAQKVSLTDTPDLHDLAVTVEGAIVGISSDKKSVCVFNVSHPGCTEFYKDDKKTNQALILSMSNDENGNIYIGTDSGKIYKFDDNSSSEPWLCFATFPYRAVASIDLLKVSHDNVYMALNLDNYPFNPPLWVISDGTWSNLWHGYQYTWSKIDKLALDSEGNMVFEFKDNPDHFLWKYHAKTDSWSNFLLPKAAAVYVLDMNTRGNIVVGTDSGLYQLDENSLEWYPVGNQLPIENLKISADNDMYTIYDKKIWTLDHLGLTWKILATDEDFNQAVPKLMSINIANESLYAYTSDGKFWENKLNRESIGKWDAVISIPNDDSAINNMELLDKNLVIGSDLGKLYVADQFYKLYEIGEVDGSMITALAKDNKDFFVATLNSNVYKYSINHGTISKVNLGKPDANPIGKMVIDNEGTIYVKTGDGLVLKCNANSCHSWEKVADPLEFGKEIHSIGLVNNNLYVGTTNQLWQLDKTGKWQELPKFGNDQNIVLTIVGDANNKIYAGNTDGEVWVYDQDIWKKIVQIEDTSSSNIYNIRFDSSNNLYFSNGKSGIWKYNLSSSDLQKVRDSSVGGNRSLVVDSNGMVLHGLNGAVEKYFYEKSGHWKQIK